MNWETKEIDIGYVREGRQITGDIKVAGLTSEIKRVQASCGCVKPKYNKEKGIITFTYKAGYIPNQVIEETQPIRITITVTYKNNTQDFLKVVGIKTRHR